MTWWFHVANALFLVSYAVKDILWLRLVTCVASVFTMVALSRVNPSWELVAWQSLFFVINFGRLIQLVYERSPVKLDADARQLATSVFTGLRPRELLRLLAVGEIVEHSPGTRIIQKGQPLASLAVVITGTARVELRERKVELVSGAFIGELSYLTGRKPRADVVAATSVRVVAWPTAALRGHLDKYPDTRTAVQLVIGADIATKLRDLTTSHQPTRLEG